MGVINYDTVEKEIKAIEQILEPYDVEEKLVILKFVNQRVQKIIRDSRVNDTMQNMNFKDLMKQMFKKKGGDE